MANPIVGTELIDVLPVNASNSQTAAYRETVSVSQLTQNSVGGSVAAYATSTLTKTDTNLAAIPGMTVTLLAGAVYDVEVYLTGTANASGGLKLAFGGTATANSVSFDTWVYNTTTVAAQGVQNTSISGSLIANTGAFTTAFIAGTIQVNAGGTFTLTAAQNASFGTGSTFAVNSNMIATRIA